MVRVLVILASLAFQFGIYYYLWRRLIRDAAFTATRRRRLTAFLVIMAVSVPLMMMATRLISPWVARTIGWPVFLWMALAALTVTVLGLVDLARLAGRGTRLITRRPAQPVDPSRRAFMSRAIGGGALATAASLGGHGVYQALKTPGLVDVPIELSRLPAALDGFTIIQLSDVHIGNTIGRSFIQDMVDRTNQAGGDLIAITGDLIDGTVEDLRDAAAPLADLRAPHGVYFVTGNHEYYAGADEWIAHLRSLGIRVLRNERVSIGRGADSFDLAGVDDYESGSFPGHGPDLATAVAGRDSGRELVLLAHQPRQIRDSVKHGVGLQLSGHTHGGQIWPWHYVAKAQQGGLLAGHSRHGDTQLYVSRGTGYWGPPVRVFAPAEITRVVLRHGARTA